MYKKDLENKIGLKQTHHRCMHINKEVLRGQHYRGKLSYLFQEISTSGCLSEAPVCYGMTHTEQTAGGQWYALGIGTLVYLFNVYKHLMGSCNEDEARFFSVVSSDKTRRNVYKLKYRKSHLNIRKRKSFFFFF